MPTKAELEAQLKDANNQIAELQEEIAAASVSSPTMVVADETAQTQIANLQDEAAAQAEKIEELTALNTTLAESMTGANETDVQIKLLEETIENMIDSDEPAQVYIDALKQQLTDMDKARHDWMAYGLNAVAELNAADKPLVGTAITAIAGSPAELRAACQRHGIALGNTAYMQCKLLAELAITQDVEPAEIAG